MEASACGYAPDGRRIVSASADRTLKLWKGESGEYLTILAGHAEEVIN